MRSIARILIAGGAAAATVAALVSCTPPSEDSETTTINIGTGPFSVNFDPIHDAADLVGLGPHQAVYEPLIAWDRSSETYEPWLAEEYEVSEDGLLLSVKLREDVEFTDGTHMDAEGIEYYYDTLFSQEGPSVKDPLETDYEPVVTATGEYTLEIATTRPIRWHFFYLVSLMPIASPTAIDDPESLATTPVGSGPYLIEEIQPEVSVKLVRNPDYWNPEAFDFDEVTFTVFSDDVAALNALKSGQIDATELDIPLAVEAENEGFAIHTGVGQFGTLVFLDRTGTLSAPIGDVRVRRAINMAFDKETIAETLNLGYGEVSSQAFTAGQAEYLEGEDDFYTYDPERAKELLAEAGYPDGFELTIMSGGASPSFFANTAAYEPVVQQQLADIGITVTYEIVEVGEFIGAIPDFAVMLFPHIYTNVLPFMGGADGFFAPNGVDPTLGPLKELVEFGSEAESREASQQVGRLFLDDAWFAPFSKAQATWATVPEVEVAVGQVLFIGDLRQFSLAE